jgi:hypothetical protein
MLQSSLMARERLFPSGDSSEQSIRRRVKYQRVEDNCRLAIEDIISRCENLEQTYAVLGAVRRIMKIKGYSVYQATFNRSDILYDLNWNKGVNIESGMITSALQTIIEFEAALRPLADYKAYSIPQYRRPYEATEVISIGYDIVARAIWIVWDPDRMTNADVPDTLLWQTLTALKWLEVTSHQRLSIDGLNFEKLKEGRSLVPPALDLEEVREPLTPFEQLRLRTSKIPLEQVMRAIDLLDSRPRFAVLRAFGYVRPDLSNNDLSRELGIGPRIMANDKLEGVEALSKILDEQVESKHPPYLRKLQEPESPYFFEKDGTLVSGRSFRVDLLSLQHDKQFLARLNASDRNLIRLATQMNGNQFVHSKQEIAELLGIDIATINTNFYRMRKLLTGELPQIYVNEKGEKIFKTSAQYQMIELAKTLQPYQRASLNERLLEIFLYLSTPNQNGQYPSYVEAGEKLQFSTTGSVPRTIVKCLQSQRLLTLHHAIETAQARYQFNPKEGGCLSFIVRCIQNGTPIMSNQQVESVNYDLICQAVSVNSVTVWKLLAVTLPSILGVFEDRNDGEGKRKPIEWLDRWRVE